MSVCVSVNLVCATNQELYLIVLFGSDQGLVKGAILCFRNPYFYFKHGESTSASQLSSPASQKSKDLNKVPLLLKDLAEDFKKTAK